MSVEEQVKSFERDLESYLTKFKPIEDGRTKISVDKYNEAIIFLTGRLKTIGESRARLLRVVDKLENQRNDEQLKSQYYDMQSRLHARQASDYKTKYEEKGKHKKRKADANDELALKREYVKEVKKLKKMYKRSTQNSRQMLVSDFRSDIANQQQEVDSVRRKLSKHGVDVPKSDTYLPKTKPQRDSIKYKRDKEFFDNANDLLDQLDPDAFDTSADLENLMTEMNI